MKDFRLGKLNIKKVFESEGAAPMTMALPDIRAEDLKKLRRWYWSDELTEDPATAPFKLSMHSYVIQVDGKTILVDACNGNDKQRSVEFASMLKTPYLENLSAAGLRPEDIDIVLCTHLHCDHVGWNTRLENGEWVPTFPNATYIFSRKDYEFFSKQEEEALHREAYLDSVLPIMERGLAQLVEADSCVHREIEDGVWLEPAFGHSPGCVIVNAERGGERAVFSGDVFHHPIQLVRPDLPFFADYDSKAAVKVRKDLFNRYANSDTLLFPAHFGGVSAGRIKEDADGFRYEFVG